MRYGSPSTEGALQELLDQGVDDVLIVPMYPHYAMSSYETAVVHMMESVRKLKPDLKTTLLPPFYQDPDYIAALVERARPALEDGNFDKLVFSFHGIPQRHLVKGDPSHNHCMTTPDCCNTCHPAHATCYRHQCAMTVEKFVAAMGIPKEKYMITFQSRLGREPWLNPYTDQTLEQLAEDGNKRVKVICAAFTADCLETLEEIAQEGREIFPRSGRRRPGANPLRQRAPEIHRVLEQESDRPGRTAPTRPGTRHRLHKSYGKQASFNSAPLYMLEEIVISAREALAIGASIYLSAFSVRHHRPADPQALPQACDVHLADWRLPLSNAGAQSTRRRNQRLPTRQLSLRFRNSSRGRWCCSISSSAPPSSYACSASSPQAWPGVLAGTALLIPQLGPTPTPQAFSAATHGLSYTRRWRFSAMRCSRSSHWSPRCS